MSDSTVELLVAEFVERRENGEALDPGTFARAHPEGGEALRNALRALFDHEELLRGSIAATPERCGDWIVQRELGRGGSGRVFLVEHRDRPGNSFALKLLTLAARFDERSLERLRREGASLQRIAHPDIVRVHEVGMLEGTPFLVLDYLDGESLAQRIARARDVDLADPRAPWEALGFGRGIPGARALARLVARVARAAEAVHREGLLHRDLKPANLVLRADASPVLIDFGLVGGVAGETLTASGDVLGTPAYMAPEQARGERGDERTDVYGIGGILYELLTLRAPHEGQDALQVLEAVRREPVAPPRAAARSLPRELDHICRRALAFRRERRFATAGDLAAVLERYANGERSPRATLSWSARVEDLVRRHRRALAIACLAGLVLIAGSALIAWRGAQRREQIAAAERAIVVARFGTDEAKLESAARVLLDLASDAPLAQAYVASGERSLAAEEPWAAALLATEGALRTKNGAQARAAAERMLALRPGDALGTGLLGLAYKLENQDDPALRELTAAVRVVPEGAMLHEALGDLHRRAKRYAESAAAYRRALELEARHAAWWYDLARAEAQSSAPETGLRSIERALELAREPVPPEYWRTKAALLDDLGRELEAIPLLRRLTEVQPSVRSFYSLGRVLDELCLLGEARAAYESALKMEPQHVVTLVSLANLYSGSNRVACAKCAAAFAAEPALLDPERAERCALDYLQADAGRFDHVVHFASYLRRIDRVERFAAEIEVAMQRSSSDEVLGRLLRAQRALRAASEGGR